MAPFESCHGRAVDKGGSADPTDDIQLTRHRQALGLARGHAESLGRLSQCHLHDRYVRIYDVICQSIVEPFMATIEVVSLRSLASVKAHFGAVVESVHDNHERVIVTRNGLPVVAIVAVADLESLEETLAILEDEAALRDLARAEREAASADVMSVEEVRELMDRSSSKQ